MPEGGGYYKETKIITDPPIREVVSRDHLKVATPDRRAEAAAARSQAAESKATQGVSLWRRVIDGLFKQKEQPADTLVHVDKLDVQGLPHYQANALENAGIDTGSVLENRTRMERERAERQAAKEANMKEMRENNKREAA